MGAIGISRFVPASICAFFSAAAVAAPTIDQKNDAAVNGYYSAAVIQFQSVAQTFEAGISGRLTDVGVMLNRTSASVGEFNLSIVSTNEGVPDSARAPLFSRDFSVLMLPIGSFSYVFTNFDVSGAGIDLVEGKEYAIAISYSITNSPDYWLTWDTNASTYAKGDMFTAVPGFRDWSIPFDPHASSVDAGFQTFVDASPVPEPSRFFLVAVGLGIMFLNYRAVSGRTKSQ